MSGGRAQKLAREAFWNLVCPHGESDYSKSLLNRASVALIVGFRPAAHPNIDAAALPLWRTIIAAQQQRREIIAWVGSQIVPHEADLRARLRHQRVPEVEIEEVVQEAYLALSRLDEVVQIRNPRAYFFTVARNVLFQRLRHERIVRIESMTDAQALVIADDDPGPDRHVTARMELDRVMRLIDALPDRCRQIFQMRRVQGLPQREIAARMGVSEKVVEAQAIRGLRLILAAIAEEDGTTRGTRIPPRTQRQDDEYRQ